MPWFPIVIGGLLLVGFASASSKGKKKQLTGEPETDPRAEGALSTGEANYPPPRTIYETYWDVRERSSVDEPLPIDVDPVVPPPRPQPAPQPRFFGVERSLPGPGSGPRTHLGSGGGRSAPKGIRKKKV